MKSNKTQYSFPIVDKERFQRMINAALNNGRKIDIESLSKDKKQRLHEWLSLRALAGIGASEVAAIGKMNPYQSAFQIWKTKVSDEITVINSNAIRAGNTFEDFVIILYNEVMGQNAVKDRYMRFHPIHDCLFANLDGLIKDEAGNELGLVEAKTTDYRNFKKWENDEIGCRQGIPLYYFTQVQHELSITGLPWCDLAIFMVDTRGLEVKRILRDDEYIEIQNRVLVDWWNNHVVAMVPPQMDAADLSFIDPPQGSFIEADDDVITALDKYKSLKAQEKEVKNSLKETGDTIKEFCGENEAITHAGDVIASWKTQSRMNPDVELLRTEIPDYYDRYQKKVTYRVLRTKN